MKNSKKILSAVLASALALGSASVFTQGTPLTAQATIMDPMAEVFTEGDWDYCVNDDGETAALVTYNGSDAEVTVPETLGGLPVTLVGENAFAECKTITSLTLPDTITHIYFNAFMRCPLLESVKLPSNLDEIGEWFFVECTSLKDITIPDTVTWIGNDAFMGCVSLESITIPDNVTTISGEAFSGCTALTNITIPESVTSIDYDAFLDCDALTDVYYGGTRAQWDAIAISTGNECLTNAKITYNEPATDNGTLVEGDWEYIVNEEDGETAKLIKYNGSDAEVTVPETLGGLPLTSIGEYAMSACKTIESLTIPDCVTRISFNAFCNCTSLENVKLPAGLTGMDEYIFEGCSSLKSIDIPDSVTWMSSGVFMNCTALESVTIPDKVTMISTFTFSGCSGLKSITIPDSVTEIDDEAFLDCDALTNVYFGGTRAQWDAITIYAGNECLKNASITYNEPASDNGALVEGDWEYCVNDEDGETAKLIKYNGSDAEVTIPETLGGLPVTLVGENAFYECKTITSVTIPDCVTHIGFNAFWDCTSLENVKLPSGFTGIDEYVFYGCTSLKSITIPDTVTWMSSGVFMNCTSLESFTIPDGVKSISTFTFSGCSGLTSITIPDSVTEIDDEAFLDCSAIKKVYFGGTKAQWDAITIYAGNECLKNAEIICSDSATSDPATSDPATSDPATSDPTTSDPVTVTPGEEFTDPETGVTVGVDTDDETLGGAEFKAEKVMHKTLLDKIQKIIDKIANTVSNISEASRSLNAAAQAIKDNKGFAFDFSFVKDGKEVQPGKTVTVIIPVPDNFMSVINKLNVYHLTDLGAVLIPSRVENGNLVFETDSFSPYVITAETIENNDPAVTPGDTDSAGASNSIGSNSNSDQQPTGITLAIAPVVLAAGAVIAVSKKRK